jgi:xanthine/uracil permease
VGRIREVRDEDPRRRVADVTDTLPGRSILGRPFKPVALGVTILMIGLSVIPVFNLGLYGRDWFDWILSTVSLAAAGLLVTGWWKNDTRWTERGLAVATFVYLARFIYLVLIEPLEDSVSLAFGVLVIIAGSYILESNDRRTREWTPS